MCIKTLIKWFDGGLDPGNRSGGRPGGGRSPSPATALGRDRWPEAAADSKRGGKIPGLDWANPLVVREGEMPTIDLMNPLVVQELLRQRDQEAGLFIDGELVAKEPLLQIHAGTHLACGLMSKWIGHDDKVHYRLEFVTIKEEYAK